MRVEMSDKVLMRIIELASEGYDVSFRSFYGNAIQIRVRKGYLNAAQVISMDEVANCKFDIVLYAINRLVEVIDA